MYDLVKQIHIYQILCLRHKYHLVTQNFNFKAKKGCAVNIIWGLLASWFDEISIIYTLLAFSVLQAVNALNNTKHFKENDWRKTKPCKHKQQHGKRWTECFPHQSVIIIQVNKEWNLYKTSPILAEASTKKKKLASDLNSMVTNTKKDNHWHVCSN